jgi:hypothetical protein
VRPKVLPEQNLVIISWISQSPWTCPVAIDGEQCCAQFKMLFGSEPRADRRVADLVSKMNLYGPCWLSPQFIVFKKSVTVKSVRNVIPHRQTPLLFLKYGQLTNNQRAAKSAAELNLVIIWWISQSPWTCPVAIDEEQCGESFEMLFGSEPRADRRVAGVRPNWIKMGPSWLSPQFIVFKKSVLYRRVGPDELHQLVTVSFLKYVKLAS